MKKFIIDNLEVFVTKKKIKNIYLRITPPNGEIKVSAPMRMPYERICSFIEMKRPWIEKHRQVVLDRVINRRYEYVSGEVHYLWGCGYVLQVIHSVNFGVCISNEQILLFVDKKSTAEERKAVLYKWYRQKLREKIASVFADCEAIVGVRASEWRIKDMKTRWGTCNIQAQRVWINLQLVRKPSTCLRYVIIHELTHLLEKYHNARFKAYMDEFMPDWREVKKVLNE